jgi:hypothetical protein
VIATRNSSETERGPAGSPAPVFLDGPGNPRTAIAKEVDQLIGRGTREEASRRESLGKSPLFLVYKKGADDSLGLKVRQHIVTSGPFDVHMPDQAAAESKYASLDRSSAAIICKGKADLEWFEHEFEALSQVMMSRQLFEVRRALYVSPPEPKPRVELTRDDQVIHSVADLDGFLKQLR